MANFQRLIDEHEWKFKSDKEFADELLELASSVKRPGVLLRESVVETYAEAYEDELDEEFLAQLNLSDLANLLAMIGRNTITQRTWKKSLRDRVNGHIATYVPSQSPAPNQPTSTSQPRAQDMVSEVVSRVLRSLSVSAPVALPVASIVAPVAKVVKKRKAKCDVCGMSHCMCAHMVNTKRAQVPTQNPHPTPIAIARNFVEDDDDCFEDCKGQNDDDDDDDDREDDDDGDDDVDDDADEVQKPRATQKVYSYQLSNTKYLLSASKWPMLIAAFGTVVTIHALKNYYDELTKRKDAEVFLVILRCACALIEDAQVPGASQRPIKHAVAIINRVIFRFEFQTAQKNGQEGATALEAELLNEGLPDNIKKARRAAEKRQAQVAVRPGPAPGKPKPAAPRGRGGPARGVGGRGTSNPGN
jgi:hypothetical protein